MPTEKDAPIRFYGGAPRARSIPYRVGQLAGIVIRERIIVALGALLAAAVAIAAPMMLRTFG